MTALGIIPARYASTRFPGKPLVMIHGMSMIERVYRQALKSKKLNKVAIATDDVRIADHVKSFGGTVYLTSPDHQSGTDRCAEVIGLENEAWDIIVNIQGDEPFIHPEQIDAVIDCFRESEVQIATLARRIEDMGTLDNSHIPKVIIDKKSFAIYFSRYAIPFYKGERTEGFLEKNSYYSHVGIYGYRSGVLKLITALPPGMLERSESLEQLRWIENGFRIKVALTSFESTAIDTPADLEKILSKKVSSGFQ